MARSQTPKQGRRTDRRAKKVQKRSNAGKAQTNPRARTEGRPKLVAREPIINEKVGKAADGNGVSRARPTPTPERRRKYAYSVIEAREPLSFGTLGIGDPAGDVQTVNYKNIAAVVSDTPLEVHEPTRENVLAHERVNEAVMARHTVIPMSFGTVFKTRDDIVELLRSAYDAFQDVLDRMEDKLEFSLKVLWVRDVIIREVEAEDEGVRRLKNEIMSQKGSTYFGRMQYGRLIDAALQQRSELYVANIFDRLRRVSIAAHANKPIADNMIMNAAFLVSRNGEGRFEAAIKELGAEFDKLTFKFTGPWPPYNFVNIRLKLERVADQE